MVTRTRFKFTHVMLLLGVFYQVSYIISNFTEFVSKINWKRNTLYVQVVFSLDGRFYLRSDVRFLEKEAFSSLVMKK